MFDFLKKKISKLVDSFSSRLSKKEGEKIEAPTPEMPIEKPVEEIKPVIEIKVPETVEKIQEPSVIEEKKQEVVEKTEAQKTVPESVERGAAPETADIVGGEITAPEPESVLPEKGSHPEPKTIREIKERVEESVTELKPEPEAIVETKGEPVFETQVVKPQAEEKPKEKKSWLKIVSERIFKKIAERKLEEKDLGPFLEELETDLLESDVALEVVDKIKDDLRKLLVGREIGRGQEKQIILGSIKQSLTDVLSVPKMALKELSKTKKPFVILFLGFNGNGKTTTIAKVAKWIIDNGKSCVIAASDCFRAAAIDQIEEHANRLGVRLIKHQYGSDPAAVAFDAIAHAKANDIDFVLIDTAGRTHTNVNLMNEMQKMIRVNKPDLKVLVVDSLIGNDAVSQAKTFDKDIGIDAVIFTKVDINPKGGSIMSVSYLLKRPILFLCMGQEYSDIKEFDRDWFVSQLVG